jgi:hypothetical protein
MSSRRCAAYGVGIFVENTVELPGTATIGCLQGAAALGLFALVFSLSVRRAP